MRTTTLPALLLSFSAAILSCQRTADLARPVADAPKPSAQALAATQPAGPDQWKVILGFTLEFPQPASVGTASTPVTPAAFSLSEPSVGGPDDDLVYRIVQPIEIKLPLGFRPSREIEIPAEYWFLRKPSMDLIDDTRGPLPGR